MKREYLEKRPFCTIIASSDFPFYAAPEADAVMDEYEKRIKELEEANKLAVIAGNKQAGRIKELEAEVIGYKASLERANFKMCEKDARIKELEAENEKLKEHVSALNKNKARWHIVADCDLPKTCEFVKAKLESGRQLKMKYANGNWFDSNEFFYDNDEDPVTHWRSLPPPPTTEEK